MNGRCEELILEVMFSGKYTLNVLGSEIRVNEFRNLIEHTIHDFEELNNFDLNITVNTEKLLSFTTNYKNINEVVEDASIGKYSKYTYLDAV